MHENVVQLSDYRNKGNGAREALMSIIVKAPAKCLGEWDAPACADLILAYLWMDGFKIVPLTPDDESAA